MAISTKQVEETKVMAGAAIWLGLISIVLLVVFWHTNITGIESLARENGRQWDYYRTLSGSMDDLIKRQESLESVVRIMSERVTTNLDNMELSKYAKIYDLDITICKIDKDNNQINKRTVIMKNVVAINPSVERTALVVETGLWYGSSVEIPTIMDSEEEYACDLKILSVK